MKLNVVTPEGKVTAHLRHVRHVMVNIYDPSQPKVIVLDEAMEQVMAVEYTTEEKAQEALTACAETIRRFEAMKLHSGDPMHMPPLAAFQLPTLVMEAEDV